jgi:hypothetical protein
MPLRNFGLSVFHRDARPNAGVTWRRRPAVSLVVGLILLAAVMAWLAR